MRFDESLRIGEDLIFNLQYLQHCRVVRHRAAFLYVYEIGHAEAATSTLKPQWFSVNLTALHIIETQLVAGIAEVDCAAYTRFLKQYVRTFFRMLIVFDQRKPISFLLLGVDTGADGRVDRGLSDSMMVVTLNPV